MNHALSDISASEKCLLAVRRVVFVQPQCLESFGPVTRSSAVNVALLVPDSNFAPLTVGRCQDPMTLVHSGCYSYQQRRSSDL